MNPSLRAFRLCSIYPGKLGNFYDVRESRNQLSRFVDSLRQRALLKLVSSFDVARRVLLLPKAYCQGYKLVGYYTNWAQYRPGMKFVPEDVDPFLCTHIIFSFARLTESGVIATTEWNDESMYRRFNDLKLKNPQLKTLLAIGGWDQPSELFSEAVSTESSRRKVTKSIVEFLRKHNFDGVDLDWEFPSNETDKKNFTLWCKTLREVFEQEARRSGKARPLLTAAVSAGRDTIEKAYEIGKIARCLDFINLMTYDFHGGWQKNVYNHAAFTSISGDNLSVQWAARYWKRAITSAGEPATKLIVGVPTFARSWTLSDPAQSHPGSPASGEGLKLRYTNQPGYAAMFEVCDVLSSGGRRFWSREEMGPYVVHGNQWYGYDDQQSLKIKTDFIKSEGLGGAMVWTIDLDDFRGEFCKCGRYPLMNFLRSALS